MLPCFPRPRARVFLLGNKGWEVVGEASELASFDMMGAFSYSSSSPFLLLAAVASPSSSSSSSSYRFLSVSELSCSVNQNVKSSSFVIARRSASASQLRTPCQNRGACYFVAESRDEESRESRSSMLNNDKTRLWSGVSNLRIAGLATTLLANAAAVGGKVSAAVEASPMVPDENSNFMFLVVCIGEAIALTGAAVGGVLARQRKVELEKINAQLRQINVNLRRQSRVESYAPNLTYAPVGSGRVLDSQVKGDPVREELMQTLKTGKRCLREQNPVSAYGEFQKALGLAQQLKDTAEEKKAARGLGASCQRQSKYKEAIKHHLLVLKVSKLTGENSGDTEAYGAIADCYTELGDLETAGRYYDQYIERLETDDTS